MQEKYGLRKVVFQTVVNRELIQLVQSKTGRFSVYINGHAHNNGAGLHTAQTLLGCHILSRLIAEGTVKSHESEDWWYKKPGE